MNFHGQIRNKMRDMTTCITCMQKFQHAEPAGLSVLTFLFRPDLKYFDTQNKFFWVLDKTTFHPKLFEPLLLQKNQEKQINLVQKSQRRNFEKKAKSLAIN